MVYTAGYKQAWLSNVYSTKGNSTLLAAIQSQLAARFAAASSGQSISSVSGNGHAVTFATGTGSGNAAADALALCGEMERLCSRSRTILVNSGIAAPTDAQIYAQMQDAIGDGVYEVEPSQFAELRNP